MALRSCYCFWSDRLPCACRGDGVQRWPAATHCCNVLQRTGCYHSVFVRRDSFSTGSSARVRLETTFWWTNACSAQPAALRPCGCSRVATPQGGEFALATRHKAGGRALRRVPRDLVSHQGWHSEGRTFVLPITAATVVSQRSAQRKTELLTQKRVLPTRKSSRDPQQ